jgi:hypothetical protein
VRRETLLAITFISVLLFSLAAGTQFISLGKANPLPEMYMRATIKNPKNTTYNTNTITLNFSAESLNFFPYLNFSYNIDAQEAKPVESITVTGQEFIPINPGIYHQWLEGSCVLSNLSEGWHNVTVYQISDYPAGKPQNGEIIRSATTEFMIAKEIPRPEFPTTLATAASISSVTIIGIGLLVYFKRRTRSSGL